MCKSVECISGFDSPPAHDFVPKLYPFFLPPPAVRYGEFPGSPRRFQVSEVRLLPPRRRMDRSYMIREWLRRELEAQERAQGPFTAEAEYVALLRELLAVIDRHTLKMK